MQNFYMAGIISIALLVWQVPQAHTQTSSTTKALEALDKALEQSGPVHGKTTTLPSKPKASVEKGKSQTPLAANDPERGIIDMPGIYLGMTCEQAKTRLGFFSKGDCCKMNQKCETEIQIAVENRNYIVEMSFDKKSFLDLVIFIPDPGDYALSADAETNRTLFDSYVKRMIAAYGEPTEIENTNTEKNLQWLERNTFIHIGINTKDDKHFTLFYGTQ